MFAIERFILHEHNAKQAGLHLDFRISQPGRDLLASYALPKAIIPKNPGDKVLAVRGNDHGRYFLNIEKMEIPDGDYGAGFMKKVQGGTVEVEGWSNNHITFIIHGDKNTEYFNGRYALIKFAGKKTHDRENLWVLVKTKKQ
jgi:hypothetical protein